MKKAVSIILALLMLVSLCACGEDEAPANEFSEQIDYTPMPSGQPDVTVVQSPSGFTAQMADNSGFLLGVQTPEDIEAMYGQPDSVTETEYSSGKIVRYQYPFGAFEFDGTLYYVEGFAGVIGPQGIASGMTLQKVAELMCEGSSSRLDGSGEVMLYGDESGDYGFFSRLTEEFVGSNGIYQLDYRAVTDAGKYKLTVNFADDMTMTVFTLQLS